MQDSFDCELRVFIQDAIKRIARKYALNITRVHTPFAQARALAIANMHAFSISRVFNLLACMHVPTAVDQESFL